MANFLSDICQFFPSFLGGASPDDVPVDKPIVHQWISAKQQLDKISK